MTTDAPTAGEPTLRADARRNYRRVLGAARAVFAEHGTDASLRDVARRAGVGIGTLYRHFPTREALLEAILSDRFDTLRTTAEHSLAAASPVDALVTWLRDFATVTTTYQGLPATVMAAKGDEGSRLHASCEAMQAAGARLLARAQEDGIVRPEVTAAELFALAAAIAWVSEQAPEHVNLASRLMSLVMTGVQT